VGKSHELAGVAIDAGARVDHEHGLSGAGKQRADGRALDAGMQTQ